MELCVSLSLPKVCPSRPCSSAVRPRPSGVEAREVLVDEAQLARERGAGGDVAPVIEAEARRVGLAAPRRQIGELQQAPHALQRDVGDRELSVRRRDALLRLRVLAECAEYDAEVEQRGG